MRDGVIRAVEFLHDRLWCLAADPAVVVALKAYLAERPERAIAAIRQIELFKFDVPLAEVLGRIGSPAADPCVSQLLGLVGDLNWPVHLKTVEAISQFEWPVVWAAAEGFAAQESLEEVRRFCKWAADAYLVRLPELHSLLQRAIEYGRGNAEDKALVKSVLADIAALPLNEGPVFSGRDHDRILYGAKGSS